MAAPLHSLLRSGDSDEGQKKDDRVTSVHSPGLHTPFSLCHPRHAAPSPVPRVPAASSASPGPAPASWRLLGRGCPSLTPCSSFVLILPGARWPSLDSHGDARSHLGGDTRSSGVQRDGGCAHTGIHTRIHTDTHTDAHRDAHRDPSQQDAPPCLQRRAQPCSHCGDRSSSSTKAAQGTRQRHGRHQGTAWQGTSSGWPCTSRPIAWERPRSSPPAQLECEM